MKTILTAEQIATLAQEWLDSDDCDVSKLEKRIGVQNAIAVQMWIITDSLAS